MILDLPIPSLLAEGPFNVTFARESPQAIKVFSYRISSPRTWPAEGADQRVYDRIATMVKLRETARLQISNQDFEGEDPSDVIDAVDRLLSVSILARGRVWCRGKKPFDECYGQIGLVAQYSLGMPNLAGVVVLSDKLANQWQDRGAAFSQNEPSTPSEHLLDPDDWQKQGWWSHLDESERDKAADEVNAILAAFASANDAQKQTDIKRAMIVTRLKRAALSKKIEDRRI